jgi:hypothetical protein
MKVKHSWVKGHYKGAPKLEHLLNIQADKLATHFNAIRRQQPISTPPLPPTHEIELFQDHAQITSRVSRMIIAAQHTPAIEAHIRKRANWSLSTFESVDWEAHALAMSSYKRVTQLCIVKLAHGLYHTKRESKKMYGTTDTCPCCNRSSETQSHVFRCQESVTSANRAAAKSILEKSLLANTPKALVTILLHGIQQWEMLEDSANTPTPLYRGSVVPSDIALVQAFHSQSTIGWDQLLRGRLSIHWSRAYTLLLHHQSNSLTHWAKTVISQLWTYSMSLWKFRNGIVHGHTAEETKCKEADALWHRIKEEYASYLADKYIVSPQYSFLFTNRTLQETLSMDRDSMSSWLRTVVIARENQMIFRSSLPTIKPFLRPKTVTTCRSVNVCR